MLVSSLPGFRMLAPALGFTSSHTNSPRQKRELSPPWFCLYALRISPGRASIALYHHWLEVNQQPLPDQLTLRGTESPQLEQIIQFRLLRAHSCRGESRPQGSALPARKDGHGKDLLGNDVLIPSLIQCENCFQNTHSHTELRCAKPSTPSSKNSSPVSCSILWHIQSKLSETQKCSISYFRYISNVKFWYHVWCFHSFCHCL